MENFIKFCKHQHDVECNQKYDKTLPYSFHLNLVAKQVEKFRFVLEHKDYIIAILGAWGHDLIEDARVTYNDVSQKPILYDMQNPSTSSVSGPMIDISKDVSDVIYSCTELRGKNRGERHGSEYIQGLKDCRLGLFVKLCDIIANVSYGMINNSSMYYKYQKEYQHLYDELYTDEFKPLWSYLKKLLEINK